MRRWLVRLGVGAVVLAIVLVVAAKLVLRSGFAANKVAAQIQEAAGAPVRVASVDVGLSGSSLQDLQFLEGGAADGSARWAVIPLVDADLSITQLLRSELAAGTVTLRGPKITLRLDRDNNLVTKLPSPQGPGRAWPAFKFVNAQVTF